MSTLKRAGNVLTEQDKIDIRRDIGLGTAAQLDVPASGNATSGQVVKGSDTRLSDARTPTSHTHTASAISDFSSAADARIAAASINALADVAVTSPSAGQVLKWDGSAWVNDTDAGGAGATNLTYTASPTGGTVHSDTGADATVPLSDGTNAGLLAPAQHAKLAGVAANATANSSDATLLARANHTGTQAASTISDFSAAADARISAAVSVTVASAAQGTDAREWTAATVDQAEAEAGAATTRRAWTAQRVAQAIAAQVATWWTSISTAAGRALVTAADAAAQRTALGLGTAATTAASAYATSAQGVPAGGTTAQVLAKVSATDYATEWVTPSGGGSPGGSSGQPQWNNGGVFAGMSGSSWNDSTQTLAVKNVSLASGGELVAPYITVYQAGGMVLLGVASPGASYAAPFAASTTVASIHSGSSLCFRTGPAHNWPTNVALSSVATNELQVNNGTNGTLRDLKLRSLIQQPPSSVTPASNGDLLFEATSNTTITVKLKGSDGTVRTGTITLS